MALFLSLIIWSCVFLLWWTSFSQQCYVIPICPNYSEIAFLRQFQSVHGKDPSSSDSYRAIALPPTLSKALEWVLLLLYPEQFSTSELQYGFKRSMSTSLCTGTVKNVANRYVHCGSPVFSCLLDVSKAFDLVRHDILFDRLLQRDLPPLTVSFLLGWYKSQQLCVRWCNTLSESFTVSNGVRQGGVLSPILFTIYMDELLLQLKRDGIGCHWGHLFAGAFCYADDLILLAPSLSALRIMLCTCEAFAVSPGLKFNSSKTQLIRFGRVPSCDCQATVSFGGTHLCQHCCKFGSCVNVWSFWLRRYITPPRPETWLRKLIVCYSHSLV